MSGMSDLAAVSSHLMTAARTAALVAESDPTVSERVERIVERLARIEESIAMLMNDDVPDVPITPEADDAPTAPDPNEGIVGSADITDSERDKLADEHKAMPDGAYPIRNVADLHNAIRAFGRAKDPVAVKRWIKKRARELGAEGVLPDSWD